jgi:hypothetical protein
MMRDVPDYDDTEMTNEEFEAAIAHAEPVELLAVPSVFSWSERWGCVVSGPANQGVRALVRTGGDVAWCVASTTSVSMGDRQAATV